MKNTIEINPKAEKVIRLAYTTKKNVWLIIKSKQLPLETETSVKDYIKVWYSPYEYCVDQYICKSGWENHIPRRCYFSSLQELFDDIIEYGYEIALLEDQEKALEILKNNL